MQQVNTGVTDKPQPLNWINGLRVIALFAVIILHSTSPLLGAYGKVSASDWFTADVYNSLSRFAVPIFVMITGALLLHREYELGDFLKIRLVRVVIPFLFWSLVYVAYSWYNEEITFGSDAWFNTKQILHLLKLGSSYHLWYVYMLIGLYLFIPVISKFIRNATENEILYFLVVWFGVVLLEQPYLKRFEPSIEFRYFEGYLGYLVLGHYLAFKKIEFKRIRLWLMLLMLLSFAVMIFGTYWLFGYYNGISTLLYEPVNPAVVIVSSTIFLLARSAKPLRYVYINKVISFIGSYAYGMYLGHALVLYFLDDLSYIIENFSGISYKFGNPVYSIPLTAVICFCLTFTLIWLINKIPFIGKYISG